MVTKMTSQQDSAGTADEKADGSENGLDYKTTLFLPKTDFPMKAGLPKAEPKHLERWAGMGLYRRLREQSKGREQFVLHDGPPYANGDVHMGHALNKILKDMVVRSQQMMGKDSNYVPGWDCHGLPIEWKVEEKYRSEGKDKDQVPINEFRKECRDYAAKWVDIQREGFKRFGIEGDWDRPYTTMSFDAEGYIVREFLKFLMDGSLYLGSKPVMWSVVEKTALAEAEVEYADHKSPTIWVRFPIVKGPDALRGASVVIWTTTPWTIPGNRAVSYSDKIDYALYEIGSVAEGSLAKPGEKIILAKTLQTEVAQAAGIEELRELSSVEGLRDVVLAHPFRGHGFDFDVPMLEGDHVTADTGTGFVHTAPGHGQDDFEIGMKYGIEVPHTVAEDGVYYEHVPLFAGKRVLKPNGKDGDANGAVIGELIDKNALLAKGRLTHSYPHSWRSKAPLIFRNTPQWFISMEKNGLRDKALTAIDETQWFPPRAKNRIRSMVETRPDWVVSRQRAWGVPLTLFVHKKTREVLRDEAVNQRIIDAVHEEGADVWFASDASRFLGNDYNPDDYEMVQDILDVWFDSGSTHSFVLEQRDDLKWPASLYLEGSDQHRGWFQSSLLEACGTRGRAPYEAVLTHGFLLDQKGFKMSKSGTNAMDPQKVIAQNGAETLRLWVANADFTEDLRVGPEIIKNTTDAYRKLRNTLRFMVANLSDWDPSTEALPVSEMPELDRWVLHRLVELDEEVRTGYSNYNFNRVFNTLFNFCTNDLSAFYFDIRKDALYCDPQTSIRRRAARTVLDALFNHLTVWLAPILVFTMEEVWRTRHDGDDESVHLEVFPEVTPAWRDDALAAKWKRVREMRRVITGALEIERRAKTIGSSLEAAPTLFISDEKDANIINGLDLAEISITSAVVVDTTVPPESAFTLEEVPGIAVSFGLAKGKKCGRCWMILPDVGLNPKTPDLCGRCSQAVEIWQEANA